jgi:hypothetical protein
MVKERFVGSIAASVVLTGVAVGPFFHRPGLPLDPYQDLHSNQDSIGDPHVDRTS